MAADCGPTCYKGPLAVYSVARARKGWKGKERGGGRAAEQAQEESR